MNTISRTRHIGITTVSIFAIVAGLGEIVVGFTGNYLRHPLEGYQAQPFHRRNRCLLQCGWVVPIDHEEVGSRTRRSVHQC
jgi:hypothetical protein